MPSTRVGLALICVQSLVISFVLTPPGASADTINGCVKQNNGKLRLVADLGQCNNNEAPVSWESEGPQGPEGSDGPQGPAGPQGDPAPAAPAFELVGFTSVTVQGGEGFLGMTSICSAEFPGSRFCNTKEIIETVNVPASLEGEAWVTPLPEGSGNGLNTNSACQISQQGFWTESGVNFLVSGTTVDATGGFGLSKCIDARSIACCAPVP